MTGILTLDAVNAGYDAAIVLEDVSLCLSRGRSLAVLGRNGMGKTTLLSTIMGLTQLHGGCITLDGCDLAAVPAFARARRGIGWVPQERGIFAPLTVEENLTVAARPGPWTLDGVFRFFPILAERRHNAGNQLSGGEQQMLAIGRALMTNPRILLLDEPLEGLAPGVAQEVLETLATLMSDTAMAIVIVEQHPQQILPLAHDAVILERGRIVYQGAAATLMDDTETLTQRLGIDSNDLCSAL